MTRPEEDEPGKPSRITALRPADDVHKLLISTPAHIVGDFESQNFVIAHAWPALYFGRRNWFHLGESPLSRTALVVTFRTPPPADPAPGVVVPNYERAGEIVAAALSLLFGKRFDYHGPLEMSGYYNVPDLATFTSACNRSLRWNDNRPRIDFPIDLNLTEISRISPLLLSEETEAGHANFFAAAGFYHRALLAIEDDPEVAYLHLVTAGEVLANAFPYDELVHMDDETRELLHKIAKEMPEGARISNVMRSKLRGVRRRFVDVIVRHIDDGFFCRHDCKHKSGSFKKGRFVKSIAAAYDLRSRYVHTGYSFGRWVSLHLAEAEIQLGRPVVPDKDLAELLSRAPLFSGLERVMRYALLGFARELGAQLDHFPHSPTNS